MSRYKDKLGNEIPDEAFENDAAPLDESAPDRYSEDTKKAIDKMVDDLKKQLEEDDRDLELRNRLLSKDQAIAKLLETLRVIALKMPKPETYEKALLEIDMMQGIARDAIEEITTPVDPVLLGALTNMPRDD